MADNTFNIKVVVGDNGTLKLAERGVDRLGGAVDRVGQKHKGASKSAADFFDTQAKGVIGTANSTRSFSKLAESLGKGGSSGLVGAYATLAANIFAVSAAFNALRGASQVEQIFKGLEAAGTRLGLSLNTTARGLKDVVGAAISTEEALRATAQITSAGFNSAAVERLGKAARDTSFALGRNMTDSLDRLSRGVVKLEPELLDELGIMTKLTESNQLYAQQLGKTESQLTNFEKRQGFMNAVLTEAELKFGGLAEAAGSSTAYDKLAASFSDLTNTILNTVNVIAKPIANLLAGSSTALLGTMILFASTLKSQLLPGLANAAAGMQRMAEETKKASREKLAGIQVARNAARAQAAENAASAANFDYIGNKGPKAYLALRDSIKAGTNDTNDYHKALVSLNRSLNANQQILDNNKNYQGDANPKRAEKLGEQARINEEIAAVTRLRDARNSAANTDVESNNKVLAAQRAANIASREALAQTSGAASIGAASQLKLGESWKQLTLSVRAYGSAQVLASATGATALTSLRTAAFAASVGVRAIGVAFLTFLPYLGLIVAGVGLMKSAYEALKSDAVKRLEKATADLNEVTAKANDYGRELVRVQESLAPPALRAAQALTIQANAVREATEKFAEYAYAQKAASNESFFEALFNGGTQEGKVASWWEALGNRSALSYSLGLEKGSRSLDLAESLSNFSFITGSEMTDAKEKAVQFFNSLDKASKPALDAALKARGGYDAFKKSLEGLTDSQIADKMRKLGEEVTRGIGGNAEKVKSFQEAVKNLDKELADFSRSAIMGTPYDQAVKGFDSIKMAIDDLQTSVNSSDFSAMLTGLGPELGRSLSYELSKSIEEFTKNDSIVQNLTAEQASRAEKGQTLNAVERERLDLARSVLTIQGTLGQRIQEEIEARNNLFRQAQEQTRLYQSQLTLLNAQTQANSNIYKVGGAGRAAQIEDEQRSRDLQKAQLEVQISVQRTLIGQAEATLAKLQSDRASLPIINERYRMELAISKIMAEQQLLQVKGLNLTAVAENKLRGSTYSAANGRTVEAERVGGLINTYQTANRALIDMTKTQFSNSQKALALDTQIAGVQRNIRDQLDGIKALSTQIAAINATELTAEVKRAQIIEAQRAANSQFLSTLNEQSSQLDTIEDNYRAIDAIISGSSDRLSYQLSVIRRSADVETASLRRKKELGDTERQSQLRLAKAEASRTGLTEAQNQAAAEGVQFAKNAIVIADQQYQIDAKLIETGRQRAELERAMFDSRKEGLEWQQQSLESMQKLLDVQRALREEEQSRFELQVKLAAKRRGTEVSQIGQDRFEIDRAAIAYKFALSEVGIKKGLIDLEYALLEAQRDNLTAELQARKTVAGLSKTQIDQLDTVIGRISNLDFDAAANSAKHAIDVAIENKRLELEVAVTPTSGRESSFIMKGMQSVTDAIAKEEIRRRAQSVLRTPTAEDKFKVVIDKERRADPNPASNPGIQATDKLREAIVDLTTKINAWMVSNPTQSVSVPNSEYATAKLSNNVKTSIDFFLEKGLSASKAAAVVGNLQQESGGRIDPRAVENRVNPEAGGMGIAQWGRARRAQFQAEMGKTLQESDLTEQLEFMWREMTGQIKDQYEKGRLAAAGFWKASNDNATDVKAFSRGYERPAAGSENLDRRTGYAKAILNAMEKKPVEAAKTAADITIEAARKSATLISDIVVQASSRGPSKSEISQDFEPLKVPNIASAIGDISKLTSTSDKAAASMDEVRNALNLLDGLTEGIRESLGELGPQGEIVLAVYEGMRGISSGAIIALETFQNSSKNIADLVASGMSESQAKTVDFANKFSAAAAVAQQALTMVQSAVAGSAKAKQEAVDKEIAAEQRRDGKSAESVAKITALEKKKDEIGKKQFNTNKKLMMAQAVIATATGIAQALSYGFPLGPILAGVIGAMGAAQLAIISGTQYQSSGSANVGQAAVPASLSIGKRGDTIDLARQNNNVGGELGYLRGRQGTGSNSSNYSVIGSAYGGEMPRGYGNTAYVVGEKGPETIIPTVPVTVRPANDNPTSAPVSANFNISALDASGIEDVLMNQRGNIISMLREASNANGTPFMENVNVNSYSRPNKTGNSRL